jgi:hypothetical protein
LERRHGQRRRKRLPGLSRRRARCLYRRHVRICQWAFAHHALYLHRGCP